MRTCVEIFAGRWFKPLQGSRPGQGRGYCAPPTAGPIPLASMNCAPVVALVADLIFASKIGGVAAHLQIPVEIVRTPEKVSERSETAAGVLLDFSIENLDGPSLIRQLKASRPNLEIIVFLPHVEVELAKQAREAGADQVLARAAFVSKLPRLLQDLAHPDTGRSAETEAPNR